MKRTHFKIKVKRDGEHIRATVFSGNEGETLANCGELCFKVGEWQLFGCLLALGMDSKTSVNQHCIYTVEGEEEALR